MPLLQLSPPDQVDLTWRIDAPVDRVWACLTRSDLLPQWLGRLTDGRVAAGAQFVIDHGEGHLCRSTTTGYVEAKSIAFTWAFPREPQSAVSIALEAGSAGTELRLMHDALGPLTSSYRDGWCVHLSYLEAAALGTPLPPTLFWSLHGTIERLNAPRPVG